MDISLKQCCNPEAIRAVFTNPAIWDTIAEDNQNPEEFEPDFRNELYLAVWVDYEIIGFYAFRVVNWIELDVHAQILPEHRKKHALASGLAMIEWFNHDAPARFKKLTAQIPFKYPNVKNFGLSIGFEIEGINRQSYMKNGEIYDQWHLGYIRKEASNGLD